MRFEAIHETKAFRLRFTLESKDVKAHSLMTDWDQTIRYILANKVDEVVEQLEALPPKEKKS